MDESNGGHLPQHLVCEGTEQPPYLIFLLLHQRQELLTVKSQGNPVLPGLCPDQHVLRLHLELPGLERKSR